MSDINAQVPPLSLAAPAMSSTCTRSLALVIGSVMSATENVRKVRLIADASTLNARRVPKLAPLL